MTKAHVAESKRRARIALLSVVVLSVPAACRSSAAPSGGAASPVGTYVLFSCSVRAEQRPAPVPVPNCEYGGSARIEWPSGRFELAADGTARRVLYEDLSASGHPLPSRVDSVAGTWTRVADTIVATWSGRSLLSPVVWIGADTLRDNTISNDELFFWFVRSP